MKPWATFLGVGPMLLAAAALGLGLHQPRLHAVDATTSAADRASDEPPSSNRLQAPSASTALNTSATPTAEAPEVKLSPGAEEISRLVLAGIDPSVIEAFVEKSPTPYPLQAKEIVRLHELGVPSSILAAMIRHEGQVRPRLTPASASAAADSQHRPAYAAQTPGERAAAVAPAPAYPAPAAYAYPPVSYYYPSYSVPVSYSYSYYYPVPLGYHLALGYWRHPVHRHPVFFHHFNHHRFNHFHGHPSFFIHGGFGHVGFHGAHGVRGFHLAGGVGFGGHERR